MTSAADSIRPKRIVLVTAEFQRLASVGKSGEVAASLASAFADLGYGVDVMMPYYGSIDRDVGIRGERTIIQYGGEIWSPFPELPSSFEVYTTNAPRDPRVTVRFLSNKHFFTDASNVYGDEYEEVTGQNGTTFSYAHNLIRFSAFTHAALQCADSLNPNVIFFNDWPTGLGPVFQKTGQRKTSLHISRACSAFLIHNIEPPYRGIFDSAFAALTGVDKEYWKAFGGIFHEGKLDCVKAGAQFADHVFVPSERYAEEIQSSAFSGSMSGLFRNLRGNDKLHGVINGIDLNRWNPSGDQDIGICYSLDNYRSHKALIKRKLIEELNVHGDLRSVEYGINEPHPSLRFSENSPLIGMVMTLQFEKGLDVFVKAVPAMVSAGALIFVMGTGGADEVRALINLEHQFPGSVRAFIGFDQKLHHKMFAGSDMVIKPARSQPNGRTQLIAMRYGAVPIVSDVGGLHDTVIPYGQDGARGFRFSPFTAEALAQQATTAIGVWRNPTLWLPLVRNGMQANFSWHNSAQRYARVLGL